MRGDRRTPLGAGSAVALLAGLVLAACSGAAEPAPQVEVVDAFTIPGSGSLAVYLELANAGGPDRIVGAALVGDDRDLTSTITLHETVVRDGLSIMEPSASIDVAGDARTALEPGGGHLMLDDLTEPVALGDQLSLELQLERSGTIPTTVTVVSVEEALSHLDGQAAPR